MHRHLNTDRPHTILHRRNRALVAGKQQRLRLGLVGWVALPPVTALCGFMAYLFAHDGQWGWSGACLLVAVPYGTLVYASFRLRAHFNRDGHLLTATVTDVDKRYVLVPTVCMLPETKIHYRFVTPGNREQTGVVDAPTFRRRVPSPGEHLAILYARGAARVM